MANPNPNAGRFVWHELVTSDPARAARFYGDLFGWTASESPMPGGGTYRMFSLAQNMVGGAMLAPREVPSNWLVYVAVQDVDAAAKKIGELGGRVMVPPTTVPDMLRFACGMDPTGAAFGVLQGLGERSEEPLPDGPPVAGSFCWDELHTRDLAKAKAFYGGLFGWTGKGDSGGMEYWHWIHAGKEIGGLTSHMGGADVPPHWLAYIAVADVDAVTRKAVALGGKVMMPATEIPKVGKFSVVRDPTGAVFSPFRSARS
ncbi:MAG: VOC family protein [Myxococcales bacterium]|nr:VOC family protein [Myxococcales bacterium]